MRSSLGLVGLLIAAAIVMYLYGQQAKKDVQEIRTVSLAPVDGTQGKRFDPDAARSMVDRLRTLTDAPTLPDAELRQAADTAAAWVAGSRPGTPEHHVAVSLRAAAVELMAAGGERGETHRTAARRHLDSAAMVTITNRPPDSVSNIRDQIQNIQTSTTQQRLETDRPQE